MLGLRSRSCQMNILGNLSVRMDNVCVMICFLRFFGDVYTFYVCIDLWYTDMNLQLHICFWCILENIYPPSVVRKTYFVWDCFVTNVGTQIPITFALSEKPYYICFGCNSASAARWLLKSYSNRAPY